ncbi:MAG: L-rhamnose isomerase, partial [Bacteroidales bacterium]|nr:L-rhamnose isomerase [Bacteroidales bacterium]
AAANDKILTIDTGHYHPTEMPGDKDSAVLPFLKELMLHVSRPVRWDSDHVTIMDDPTQDLFFEIVRANALDRVHYGLDFFDGSINRIGAYVIGSRAAQKCMTRALLEPRDMISKFELAGEGYKVLALIEEQKAMPWQAVYDEFCVRNNVPVGDAFIKEIDQYVADVISKR